MAPFTHQTNKLLVIAGPCQIESLEHSLMIAKHLHEIAAKLPIQLVYKSSFDKANRTSLTGARGTGIEAGLEILTQVRNTYALPILTDVHSVEQARTAGAVVDILQIPAFLCRQTDLLLAAGETGKAVNVKKGQFLHPEDMRFVAEKIASTGNRQIFLCERGTCHGYRDLIVDMRSLLIMRACGYPVIFDATHSVQSMGGIGGSSGGSREYVRPLLRAATAVGVDGVFIECHQDPAHAPSDGASMLPLSELEATLREVLAIRASLSQAL
jgi:2-dehydro-3-deoxyphosphooctonate aldolase (KDO 8-P synthase)